MKQFIKNEDKVGLDPEKLVFYLLVRACLFRSVLNSLTKKEVQKINKWIRQVTKDSIFQHLSKGGRPYPDTYDWRNDKEILGQLLFCSRANQNLLITAFSYLKSGKFNPLSDLMTHKDVLLNCYKAPEASLLYLAFCHYEAGETYPYLADIAVVNENFKKHSVYLPIIGLTLEELKTEGVKYLKSFVDHHSFPTAVKEPLTEL